jgi:hypothetical protein
MNPITKFFHELMNPHCSECMRESELDSMCESCETLKMQLSLANQREKELLQLLVYKQQPLPELVASSDIKPVMPKAIPWRVKQQMLEEQDRERAKVLAEQAKLEKEILKEYKDAPRTTEAAT